MPCDILLYWFYLFICTFLLLFQHSGPHFPTAAFQPVSWECRSCSAERLVRKSRIYSHPEGYICTQEYRANFILARSWGTVMRQNRSLPFSPPLPASLSGPVGERRPHAPRCSPCWPQLAFHSLGAWAARPPRAVCWKQFTCEMIFKFLL